MIENVYVRAEIIGELPSGQKQIRFCINNADGIRIYTDERCLIRPANLENCWISVNDKLPPHFVSVLGYMPDQHPLPTVRECYRTDGNDFYVPAISSHEIVTHWLPLPEFKKDGGGV